MRRLFSVFFVAAVLVTGAMTVAPASANQIGREGCSPGFWKNHTSAWEETTPSALISSLYSAAESTSLADVTNLEGLSLPGGPGVEGAEGILARAAVAAWLNAANEGVAYPWRRDAEGLDGRPPLVETVNDALESGDRATMLALAARLDQDNNLGCPLS